MTSVNPFNRIFSKKVKLVIGLMSGTSTDGVDAVLLRVTGNGFTTRFTQLGFTTIHFHPSLKKKLFALQDAKTVTLEEISRLHFALGEVFAEAAIDLCDLYNVPLQKIDLIGSHGHTIAHFPQPKKFFGHLIGATLQIGDPNVIAQRTNIITVGDFRVADIAAGGEGAPLVPYFDFLMFRSNRESRGLLNIGGISNITVVPKGSTVADVVAFDCGPGNMIVDHLMRTFFNRNFDKDGRVACSGKISQLLLRWLMNHPFIKKSPPRSTGREEFGPHFTAKVIQKGLLLQLSQEDIIATVTAYTAEAIAWSYTTFIKPKTSLGKIIVSGGGVHNQVMMRELASRLPGILIESIGQHGTSPDSKEAIAFAILANETIAGHPGNIPGATGAKKRVMLGKICLP